MIAVKYVKQEKSTRCMAACLEMLYKFFNIDRKQRDIWNKRRILRPDGSAHYIQTIGLVDDLAENNLNVLTGTLDLDKYYCSQSIQQLLNNKVPVIAIKQWDGNKSLGHAVVLLGIESNMIYYSDPEIGKKIIKTNINDFINSWQASGPEVLGGQFIIAGDTEHTLSFSGIRMTSFITRKLKNFCIEDIQFSS